MNDLNITENVYYYVYLYIKEGICDYCTCEYIDAENRLCIWSVCINIETKILSFSICLSYTLVHYLFCFQLYCKES